MRAYTRFTVEIQAAEQFARMQWPNILADLPNVGDQIKPRDSDRVFIVQSRTFSSRLYGTDESPYVILSVYPKEGGKRELA